MRTLRPKHLPGFDRGQTSVTTPGPCPIQLRSEQIFGPKPISRNLPPAFVSRFQALAATLKRSSGASAG